MNLHDELLDLVNEQDQVVGIISRSECKQRSLKNIRAVNAFIHNPQGQLLIPTRSSRLRVLPGALDFSISGCVQAGETYLHGLAREAAEEMNLAIAAFPFRLLHKYNPYRDNCPSFCYLYLIASDITPAFNPEEFACVEWLFPQEIIGRFDQGTHSKTLLRPTIERFFL